MLRMAKDPICGMAVDPKKAKKKGLSAQKQGKTAIEGFYRGWLEKFGLDKQFGVTAVSVP